MEILFFDIETAPIEAYIWGIYEQTINMDFVKHDWYILCWSAKWLNGKKVISSALPDFKKNYKENHRNDKAIMEVLWHLLDKADVVVSHNGIRFDHKKVNARFMHHGMKPPSPFKVVDTLRAVKAVAQFTSHKLNDLAKDFKLGTKIQTGGFGLWKQCMNGDMNAWKKMVKYCKHDVVLLEKLYKRILPFIKHHPNYSVYLNSERPICTSCGSDKVTLDGFAYTTLGKFQKYGCRDCGAYCRSRVNINTKKNNPKKLITVGI